MKWQMKYYVDKCKLTRIEKNIPDFTYTMISCNLAIRTQKQELGVICNSVGERRGDPFRVCRVLETRWPTFWLRQTLPGVCLMKIVWTET